MGLSLDTDMKSGPEPGFGVLASPRVVRSLGTRRPGFHPGGAGSNDPAHKRETAAHGGQGCTNNARELFDMIMDVITERYLADIPS